ncbi:DUF6519 domain-containing protein [Hymenobacter volaticus]|uniref:DUF6519 domain-containing protein n=1 Tax=Hymenobacter volaticus TaxID=2932254 RepID=A0ABY4G1Z4_9BACT|nr:DUF6519 domain-containing protein [Hymenobacter volaticus]UOQ64805.1 DUF6519 domain-containing protein [Hymenobacter volaticus]
MASFDISRVAFDPRKHYGSVRMQQGRVLTDDDWNEKSRIEEEEQRRTQVDIIGGHGSPDNGFKIANVSNAGGFIDFDILKGALYLGGQRLQMDGQETFRLQKDWLQKKDGDFKVPVLLTPEPVYDLVYLESWQQPVSAVEDSSLFEKALGTGDTTTRMRYMRRVKIFSDTGSPDCPVSFQRLKNDWIAKKIGTIRRGNELVQDSSLKVTFGTSTAADDLCTPAIAGGYLGAENQAIRVQVTDIDYSNAPATGHFTWGFDNASPYYRVVVKSTPNGLVVEMKTAPKDQYHWPMAGQVVEFLPWSAVLPNNEKIAEQAGFMSKVLTSYNPDINNPGTGFFGIADAALPAEFGEWKNRTDRPSLALPAEFFYMRVWNRGADLASPEKIPFTVGTPVPLGTRGLEVTFNGTGFTSPDGLANNFWVIAARPSTPDVVVPWELSTTGISKHGVRLFYSPLAIIEWKLDANQNVTGTMIHDCRRRFRPLTEDECCCTYTVGDGVHSKGDFRSIQEAVDSLPAEGGKICVLPGIHDANVQIYNKQKIYISGCGEQTIVRSAFTTIKPIFVIRHSQRIRIDNMTMITLDGIAVVVEDDKMRVAASEEITIRENRILASIHAIRVNLQPEIAGNNRIKIAFNLIGMFDKREGGVAIFTLADDVVIERNRIVLIKDPGTPGGGNEPEPHPDPFDPCLDKGKIYKQHKEFLLMVNQLLHYAVSYTPGGAYTQRMALGGIQVGCGSEKVWILQNEITGGRGNGITLGHMPVPNNENQIIAFSPFLYDITIQENRIREMGHCGIGTVFHIRERDQSVIIHVDTLVICGNEIRYCIMEPNREQRFLLNGELNVAGISLAFCENCIIRENWVEQNGKNQLIPVTGIFIFFGEGIDIFNNRVVNNGADVLQQERTNAVRGGIVIWFAARLPRMKYASEPHVANNLTYKAANMLFPVVEADPAVRVHHNIVTQPLGHSLFVIAFGPVSIVDNQLISQGLNTGDRFSRLAGNVFILNLGISKDLLNIILMPLKNWGNVNPGMFQALTNSANASTRAFFILYQLLPSGKTLFNDNQVVLDLRTLESEQCISAQMILTLDDISFTDNQVECAGFTALLHNQSPSIDMVLFNTFLFSVSTRCSNNRFTDGFSYTFFSLISFALMNTAIGNQATHCLIVPYWSYRRKALNIELNVLTCEALKLEANLDKHNKNFGDLKFNYNSF